MLLHSFLRIAMTHEGILSGTFSSTISFREIIELANTKGTPHFKITLHHNKEKVKFSIPSHKVAEKFHDLGQWCIPRKQLYLAGSTITAGKESLEFSWVPADQAKYLGFTVNAYFLEGKSGEFVLKINVPYLFSVWEHQTQTSQKSKGAKRFRGF